MSEPQLLNRVALNFTDLTGDKTGCVKKGSNKFWVGEVWRNPDGTCDFKCTWGAVGAANPSTKGSKFGLSEEKALKVLESKVKSKVKKGYTELDTRTKQEEVAKASEKGVDLTKGKAPVVKKAKTFHPTVERLLSVIYGSTSSVVRAGLSSQAGATEENPIGNLSDRQLDIGGGLLDEIQELLEKKQVGKKDTLPLASGGLPQPEVLDLTNQYLSNIPREIPISSRGRHNLHNLVISSYDRLERERKFLQLLRDAHVSQATFQAAAHTNDKASVWYDGLDCAIELCEPGSQDYVFAFETFNTNQSRKNTNWWRGGKSTLRVKNVFRFSRNNTEKAYTKYSSEIAKKQGAAGKIWAWHGTRVANLLGISRTGLLMPENLPRGVAISGKAFGAGIYHAPVFSRVKTLQGVRTDGTNGALKSANYLGIQGSYYGSSSPYRYGYMFLQEVVLGKGEVRSSTCWDKPRPSGWPDNDFIYAAASRCPTLTHDEIVTFNEDAQVFRYLVELETI